MITSTRASSNAPRQKTERQLLEQIAATLERIEKLLESRVPAVQPLDLET